MRKGLGCLGIIVGFVLVIVVAYKLAEHHHVMKRMPADLEVSGIIYSTEQSWGIGLPGDNETGIVVYGLPEAIAQRISTEGVAFFNRPENVERRVDMQRTHETWLETPLAPDKNWTTRDTQPGRITIDDYLDKYGFGIPIDKGVAAMVDEALSAPGSFYSYGRTGLVIVIPKARKAIYVYAG